MDEPQFALAMRTIVMGIIARLVVLAVERIRDHEAAQRAIRIPIHL
jgi:hypothetical protein